ncbi:MAG: copper chaperone PCu(A)C [Pseudomonadota bacterium]
MKLLNLAAIAALGITGQPATAHDFTIGDLTIDHPIVFETPRSAMSGGGYLSVTNNGTSSDRLIEVSADFPRVRLHMTEESDGVARMIHVEAIEIPAGETVVLEPGGAHVMFMGLNGNPFEVGEEIPATLIFEQAGRIEVVFKVESRDAATGERTDHSGHGGHGMSN